MSGDPVIEDAVSIVSVRDIDRTMTFYSELLKFENRFISEDKSFAIAVHGDAAIHFVQTDHTGALEATANHTAIYLWVKQIDEMYAMLRSQLEMLPKGRLRHLFTTEYGMREFHVKDPDGCALLFGENA